MTLARRAGLHTPARAAAVQAVLQRVQALGLAEVRIAWADLHGSFRGKSLVTAADTSALAEAFDDGIGMVSTLLLKDSADRTAIPVFDPAALEGLPGFGAANNLLLLPDPDSFQVLPWAPRTGWLRADARWDDGHPVAVDPREVLRGALARLADTGHTLQVGLEVEFHVWRIVSDTLPADGAAWPAPAPQLALLHPGHGLLSEAWADRCAPVLDRARDTLLGLGLPLRSLEVEFGPSQFEVVLAPAEAMVAADRMVLLRNALRQALRRDGLHASFACRPALAGALASGWHVHQSLRTEEGVPAMQRLGAPHADATDARAVLSDTGAHWLAGLLAHAPGLAALCAPTPGAYGRYQGSPMAPQAAVWGTDNRGAMLRVVGRAGDAGTRIENRLAEPMANPYLCLAAQVVAGLAGLQSQALPPPACATPYAPGAGPALPRSLEAALAALAGDAVLRTGLGEPMVRVFDAIKRAELARRGAAPDTDEWDRREALARF